MDFLASVKGILTSFGSYQVLNSQTPKMNCVFEITLNARFNASECLAYEGHWCEWCGEDNGGGKFCYECGKRESEDYGNETADDDLFLSLMELENETADEEEFNYEAHMWKTKGVEVEGHKFLKFGVSQNVYRFKEFIEFNMDAEVVGKWNSSKNKIDFYEEEDEWYFYGERDSDSDDE